MEMSLTQSVLRLVLEGCKADWHIVEERTITQGPQYFDGKVSLSSSPPTI